MKISPEERKKRETSNQEYLKRFTLMDDTFMTMCFSESMDAVQHVLRTILEKPELKVVQVET